MATPRKTTPSARPSTRRKAPAPTPARGKSQLVEIGENAMREALLSALQENEWNLTRTAEALRMSAASSVIRAIHNLNLGAEYEKARKRGDVRPGARSKSD